MTISKTKPIDIFDKEICVHCNRDCSFGSGDYVNRYPHYGEEFDGWVCGTCSAEIDEELNK
jgi:hypothetical protein